MDFIVTDREGIEDGVLVRSSYIVISIYDPDAPVPRVKQQPGLRAVLQLAFDDAEPTTSPILAGQMVLMAPAQARQIWDFIANHKEQVEAVVVHCEMGMSRSPAVAAALCKAMGGDDRQFWLDYQPNLYVYRLMLEAAPKEVYGQDL
ncbi:MAG: tyrosine-protein phosphatase [Deltaproteobacteria bacterium]